MDPSLDGLERGRTQCTVALNTRRDARTECQGHPFRLERREEEEGREALSSGSEGEEGSGWKEKDENEWYEE
jgi:hypothetical protein